MCLTPQNLSFTLLYIVTTSRHIRAHHKPAPLLQLTEIFFHGVRLMAALTASCIDLNIQGNGAYSVLKQLATMALQNGFITDSHQFLQTLLLREKMHSTGFGSGVAVPHGKSACVKQPFVLFARKAQAIDWKASDGEDVNCWICLGVPQSGEEDQVKIIGTLCRKIIHQDFIHQLQQGDADQVLALLNQTLSS
ncbi:PTS system, fructose-specific IIA component [Escherichia coli TA447]|nr:PTS system, fructose-specific IIA component [Escherichia coli TA447]